MILGFLLGIPFAWWMVVLTVLFIADCACFAFEAYGWSIFIMTASIAGAIWLDHNATHIIAANLHQILLYYVPGYLAFGLGTALVKWVLYAAKRVGWIKDAKEKFDDRKYLEEDKPDFVDRARGQASNELRERIKASGKRIVNYEASPAENAEFEVRVAELAKQYEAEWAAGAPARKREAFVKFYKDSLGYGDTKSHQIYDVDHTKETSVVDALTPRAKDNIGKLTIWVYQWPIVIVTSLIEDFIIKLVKHFATALDAMFSKVVRGMVAKATEGL